MFEPDAWWQALALCVPMTWVGVSGAVISIVRDAPDPLAPPTASLGRRPARVRRVHVDDPAAVPAGDQHRCRARWRSPRASSPALGTVLRMDVAMLIVVAGIVWWIRKRDEWRARVREFMDAGRAAGRTS